MLKKVILIYHILIGIYSIVASFFVFIDGTSTFWHFIWAFLGLFIVTVSTKAILEPKVSSYNKFFFLFNFFQIISISIFGYVYKFILGSELFLSFKNYTDSIFTFQYRYFYRDFYIDEISNSDFVFIGINLVQFFMGVYFWYHMPNKEKKIKEWFKS